jgi:hypothetical protein
MDPREWWREWKGRILIGLVLAVLVAAGWVLLRRGSGDALPSASVTAALEERSRIAAVSTDVTLDRAREIARKAIEGRGEQDETVRRAGTSARQAAARLDAAGVVRDLNDLLGTIGSPGGGDAGK